MSRYLDNFDFLRLRRALVSVWKDIQKADEVGRDIELFISMLGSEGLMIVPNKEVSIEYRARSLCAASFGDDYSEDQLISAMGELAFFDRYPASGRPRK